MPEKGLPSLSTKKSSSPQRKNFGMKDLADSLPDSVMSPLRSQATSIALKKLMETQAQMLLDISAAWKKKYPVGFSYEPRSVANNDGSSVASNHCIRQSSTSQINSLLPANSILPAEFIFLASAQA
ncbi:hypothetical protein PGTUg99_037229 [Puccinia graminis f. sp. tritici]|uniref:Uncharacterized protein n=1 Tax=Puccinia graminis f. sp. tritici TaxID=56615 RepID=A0A5B0SGU8_PUCGR|nr:hypothetical protein PGTUg99_037229 [Puccinia graminis f. sp. tritici]